MAPPRRISGIPLAFIFAELFTMASYTHSSVLNNCSLTEAGLRASGSIVATLVLNCHVPTCTLQPYLLTSFLALELWLSRL